MELLCSSSNNKYGPAWKLDFQSFIKISRITKLSIKLFCSIKLIKINMVHKRAHTQSLTC